MTFELPSAEALPARLDATMSVLYLLFTDGYTAPVAAGGPDLAADAVRLTGLLQQLAPEHLDARTTLDGRMVPFDEQDRRLWRTADIARAKELLIGSDIVRPAPYRSEATTALLHATRDTTRSCGRWSASSTPCSNG